MNTQYEDNVDTTKAITHLSLCAGYDGIGIGLERVLPNLRAIAYVEVEAFAIANLVSKMESEQLDAAPIHSDVKTFPYKEFCGRVDILSGGFPCQPFSQAGVRKGVEDPRHLYPHFSRGIEECKPGIVFLENVEGIISSKTAEGQSVLQYVLSDLERLGYQATAGVFSASEVGFPHQRKRVFILGQKMVESNDNGYSENRRGNEEERRISEEHRSEVCGGLSNRTSDEFSDTISQRPRGWEPSTQSGVDKQGSQVEKERQTEYDLWSEVEGCSRNIWDVQSVARPNEQQHEWEEPRVKPKLGRTTNGTDSRVDRLRLLGNGVVPQTATKAFVILINRFLVDSEE
jgi:DNA (cytosine-5)-methyltransferase 1